MFREESLGKINAIKSFPEQVNPQILLLESLINLEQVNTSVVKKNEES